MPVMQFAPSSTDDRGLCTAGLQAAIDAVAADGGGTVVVLPGL